MPHRYVYRGDAPALIPAIHRELQPGEEFDSEVELDGSVFESLDPPSADPDMTEPAKEV